MELEAKELFRLKVFIAPPIEVGRVHGGVLRVIPIIGGTFKGQDIAGEVLPGGADWNTQFDDGTSHVEARYVLETTDGEYIVVENKGFIASDSASRIKTSPSFISDQNGKYHGLNQGSYVGELEASATDENFVEITIYRMV